MGSNNTPREVKPLTDVAFANGKKADVSQMGCLMLAGGQGTRLGWDGPKGTFPINGKSLFEYLLEKKKGSVAVMTSPENDAATREFLKDWDLDFFVQGTLPFLDTEAPDGNGGALKRFYESGLWQKWWDQGIRYLNIVLVDNVLADPFDAELLAHLQETGADIAVKAIKNPGGKVGVLALVDGEVRVIEYSELPEGMEFPYANIGLFCMTMEFAKRTEELPIHRVWKELKGAWGWKQERFIFDIFPYASKISVLIYPKEKCFAPLKRLEDVPAIKALLG